MGSREEGSREQQDTETSREEPETGLVQQQRAAGLGRWPPWTEAAADQ